MEWLISALSSAGFGSVVGLLGGLAEKFIDIKAKKLDYAHEEKMRDFDAKEALQERNFQIHMADKQIELAESEGEIKVANIEAEAFSASQEGAGKSTILTYVRAAITGYLLLAVSGLTAIIWYKVGGIDSISKAELSSMLRQIVDAAIFLSVTCVAWWFAARPSNMKFKK